MNWALDFDSLDIDKSKIYSKKDSKFYKNIIKDLPNFFKNLNEQNLTDIFDIMQYLYSKKTLTKKDIINHDILIKNILNKDIINLATLEISENTKTYFFINQKKLYTYPNYLIKNNQMKNLKTLLRYHPDITEIDTTNFLDNVSNRYKTAVIKIMKKIDKSNEKLKKQRQKAREKILKSRKTQKQRSKLSVDKQKKRTKNLLCKNDIDFVTQENIEDYSPNDLVHIKFGKNIFCLEKSSFKNIVKYSNPVRGDCKPAIKNKPLDCKWFYPINIGFNIYITKQNWENIKISKDKKFILTNKKRINFSTGLHMISEKSGYDNVYTMKKSNFTI